MSTDIRPPTEPASRLGRLWRSSHRQIIIAALIAVIVLGGVCFNFFYYPAVLGVVQPIPFSHRFHVSTKRLSCVFCHTGAIHTESAGIPPVETCMLCHKKIIIEYPKIKELTEYYNTGTPVPWVKINTLHEFVYFNHEAHVRAGFDCAWCHGDVAHMDRVVPVYNLDRMGFCVECHRDQNMSHDCFTCHR